MLSFNPSIGNSLKFLYCIYEFVNFSIHQFLNKYILGFAKDLTPRAKELYQNFNYQVWLKFTTLGLQLKYKGIRMWFISRQLEVVWYQKSNVYNQITNE